MIIKVVERVDDTDLITDLWNIYAATYKPLAAQAVQRLLMYPTEFHDLMRDQRVQKYLAIDDAGKVVGVSAVSNNLSAVPLISPEYFARNYPDHYTARKIWYIVFVAVDNTAKGIHHAFSEMVTEMCLVASTQNGFIGLDVCNYDDGGFAPAKVCRLIEDRLTDDDGFERLDQQSFWIYEFPKKTVAP